MFNVYLTPVIFKIIIVLLKWTIIFSGFSVTLLSQSYISTIIMHKSNNWNAGAPIIAVTMFLAMPEKFHVAKIEILGSAK